MPTNFTYCATKVFGKYLCQVLNDESKDKVDILCLQPSYVETKMIDKVKDPIKAFVVVTVTDCVNAALRDLGYETCSYGTIVHEFLGYAVTSSFRVFGLTFM